MPSFRILIFLTVLLTLLSSMSVFVYRRTRTVFAPPQWMMRVLAGSMVVGIVSTFAARMVGNADLAKTVGVFGGTLGLAIIIGFVLLLAAFLVERILALGARAAGVTAATPSIVEKADLTDLQHSAADKEPVEAELANHASATDEPAADESNKPAAPHDSHAIFGRRGFIAKASSGAALAVGASTSMYAGIFGRHDYVLEEVPIKLSRLPSQLDGFTIVQLSDIHLGTFVGEREIRSALELVKRAKPDLVVLTGDLLDHDPDYARVLADMAQRLGAHAPVFGIPGNHDYYAGVQATLGSLRKGGAQVLVNQGQTIAEGKIALLGVDDVWARRRNAAAGPDVQSALATMPQDLPRVLLCHNPVYFPEAAPHVDLQLSGHTHGGQINLGVRPADVVLPFGYVEGHYRREKSQLWVNRGFGTAGPPARLQAPPEVTKIILTV